jgi:predicted phosphodiesterase
MSETRNSRTIFARSIFVLFCIGLLTGIYFFALFVYSKSCEDIQLPKYLGNKPDNIVLLKESDTGSDPFSFFIVGDIQQGDFFPDVYRESISHDHPDFGVILGDFIRSPQLEFHTAFMMDFPNWGCREPVFLVCGNHDIATKKDIERNRPYSFTLNDFEETYGPANFSFTYHGCLFIILNDIDTDDYIRFLADTLLHCRNRTLMTFVFAHVPAKTVSPEITCRKMAGEQEFLTLIRDYNVDYVITGDFHTYLRARVGDTVFLVSGGGMDRTGDNRLNRKSAYHAICIHVDPLKKDVTERIYCGKGRTRIGYTLRKVMLAQAFAFFEHNKK